MLLNIKQCIVNIMCIENATLLAIHNIREVVLLL